jgi:hypothetical protein
MEPAMIHPPTRSAPNAQFEIRFESLFNEERGLAFPCDATGRVDLDALSEKGRINYLFARAMMGREYGMPQVRSASRETGHVRRDRSVFRLAASAP